MGLRFGFIYLFVALCGIPSALAQEHEPARLLGFGGALRALGFGADALYVNPAGLIRSKAYSFELDYQDDFRDSDRRINVSIADGQSRPLTGAVGYTYSKRRPRRVVDGPLRLEMHRLDVGVAVEITPEIILGATTNYVTYKRLEGDRDVGGGFAGFAGDLGTNIKLSKNIHFGLVVYNLVMDDDPERSRTWAAGVGFVTDNALMVELDVESNFDIEGTEITGAASYTFAQSFPVRAAVTSNTDKGVTTLSFGFGYRGRRIGLDFGYRQILNPELNGEDANERIIALSLRTTSN